VKLALGVLVGALAGCGGAQAHLAAFSTEWEDDGGGSIGRVWARLQDQPVAPGASVAVAVAQADDGEILGLPLGEGATLWRFHHPLDARPVVAGRVVVGSGDGEAFALDATSGRLLWRHPVGGLVLLGAGDDGSVTALSLRRAGGLGSTLVAIDHQGTLVRELETERPLGAPAVLAGTVFVPWAGQYVSVINLATGQEEARVTLRTETTRAWAEGGSLWFGEIAFVRFDERIRDASKGHASMATIAFRDLPGTPKLMRPGGEPVPVAAGADDKVRLYARPASPEGAPVGAVVQDGRYDATYFRLAMGFDAKGAGSKLAWVHLHDVSFVGGAVAKGILVLCDERGGISQIDQATGASGSLGSLGEPVRSCTVSVDGEPPKPPPEAVATLGAQLDAAVRADDPMLTSAQRFLLHELSAAADPSVTKTLVDLASDPRTSPDLLVDARAALAARRTGAAFMEAALARHYDYLRDVLRAPPVGPIAHALGAMKETAAAPLLAAHLLDPEDTGDDAKETAAALAVVAGPSELPAMRRFFAMYRASADDDEVAAAVVTIGAALVARNDREGRAEVEMAVRDPMTVPYARDRLEPLVAAPAGERAASE